MSTRSAFRPERLVRVPTCLRRMVGTLRLGIAATSTDFTAMSLPYPCFAFSPPEVYVTQHDGRSPYHSTEAWRALLVHTYSAAYYDGCKHVTARITVVIGTLSSFSIHH